MATGLFSTRARSLPRSDTISPMNLVYCPLNILHHPLLPHLRPRLHLLIFTPLTWRHIEGPVALCLHKRSSRSKHHLLRRVQITPPLRNWNRQTWLPLLATPHLIYPLPYRLRLGDLPGHFTTARSCITPFLRQCQRQEERCPSLPLASSKRETCSVGTILQNTAKFPGSRKIPELGYQTETYSSFSTGENVRMRELGRLFFIVKR